MRNKRTSLVHLIYYSRNALMGDAGMREHQLAEIARQAQKKNEFSVITSMLVVDQAFFMQVIEGERSQVGETFARITGDARHRDVQIMEWREIPKRTFVTSFTTAMRGPANENLFQKAALLGPLQRGVPKAGSVHALAVALQNDALAKQGIEHLLV